MKLISMTDFVLEQTKSLYEENPSKLIHNLYNYAEFLKQPLKLEMFVSDDESKVLFEGFNIISTEYNLIGLESKDIFINYNKEGNFFLLDSWNGDRVFIKIECLCNYIENTISTINLTPNATKLFL